MENANQQGTFSAANKEQFEGKYGSKLTQTEGINKAHENLLQRSAVGRIHIDPSPHPRTRDHLSLAR